MTDLTGQRFGKLTELGPTDRRAHGALVWACRCDCGALVERRTDYLTGGRATSCGCDYKKKREDLTGRRFGWLTVLGPEEHRRGRFTWRCRCDCGNIVDKRTDDLKSRPDISCGCKNKKRREDLTGRRFGRLTVLGPTRRRSSGSIVWECLCDCGNVVDKPGKHLKDGTVRSCGCIQAEMNENLIGKRFGKLTVLEKTEQRSSNGAFLWRCRCDCGNTSLVRTCDLKDGSTASCGCAQLEFCKTKLKDFQTYIDGTCIEFLKCIDRKTKANTSGVRGISQLKNGRYQAYIGFQGKQIFLGKYDRFEDAVRARKRGEDRVWEYLDAYYEGEDTPKYIRPSGSRKPDGNIFPNDGGKRI